MPVRPEPLCDRHDDAMADLGAGIYACESRNCARRFSSSEGYYTEGDATAPRTVHACKQCGKPMYIFRFTAHGPDWRCPACTPE